MRLKFLRVLLGMMVLFSAPGLVQAGQAGPLSQDTTPNSPTLFPDNSISLPGVAPSPPPGFDLSGIIEIPYSASLNFSGGAVTIEAWVLRTNTSRNETIFGNGWQESYWFGFSQTGKLRFTPDGYAHHADSTATILAGAWTHVAIVFNNGTYNFYVNGALDSTITQAGASLVTAPASSLMYIGYDRNPFTENYYAGLIDEVRIWRSARSPSQIQQGLFTFAGGGEPNLRAEWRLDGNANDTTGAHNGILQGPGASFVNDGALPKNLHIPQVSNTPTLDGSCGSTEYASSIGVTLLGTAVSLQHTSNDLWICFNRLDNNNNSASVFLDPEFTREDPAQAVHNWFIVNDTNVRTSYAGNGVGSYVITPTLNTQWDAKYLISGGEFPVRSAEFHISKSYLGGWDHQIGLALGKTHYLVNLPVLNMWPALAVANSPSTWSTAKLAGIGPLRSFSGTVKYVPKGPGNPQTNVGGVPVRLIGYEPDGSEAEVDTMNTTFAGSYSLSTDDSFSNHRLEVGSPPQGMVYYSATSGSGGTSVDERTIDFGTSGAGAHPNNVFRFKDAVPYPLDTTFGPVYLIIAPQAALDAGAFSDFIDYKFRLGFTVVYKSLEDIDAQMPGANPQNRIRAWEINQKNVYGGRLKYVLLAASQDRIPSVKVDTSMTGYSDNDCAGLLAGTVSFRYSDWIYVDLVSNFDTNGNGCYMDGIWNNNPANWKPGYFPDLAPAFKKTVAIGRLPYNDPTVIRKVLANTANFERQSRAYKTKSLFGVSMVSLEGYRQNGDPCDDWGKRCVAVSDSANYDMAVLAQSIGLFALLPLGYSMANFYQNTSTIAGGSGLTSPTQVSPSALQSALNAQEYGLVGLDGHGNSVGVYRVDWPGDLNHNGVMNLNSNPNLNEVTGGDMFTNSYLAGLTPDNSHAAVWLIGVCTTGSPDNASNFAGSILSTGAGVASAAALDVVGVGSFTGPDKSSGLAQQDSFFIAQRIVVSDQRIGDAVWGDYAERMGMKTNGSGQIAQTLFGDPSLSYLGDPSAGTRLAAWSMNRREPNGQAYFNLPGPALPTKLWEFDTSGSTPASPRPSLVVSAKNEVIVAAGNAVSVLRNGSLYQTLTLDAQAYGTPAVSSDGTIYVADVNGKIYAFNYVSDPYANPRLANLNRQRRWTYPLGSSPQTSPTIAPDGSILMAADSFLNLSQVFILRPDGKAQMTIPVIGKVQQAISASADRAIFVATQDTTLGAGFLYRLEPFCDGTTETCTQATLAMTAGFSTAPLLAYGYLYVGLADGRVMQINTKTLHVINAYNTHSRITVGPTSGPGGQVLVGTQSARFYSLSQDMTHRWDRLIGDPASSMPAFSDDHLYITAGDLLVALNPNSGQKVWQKYFPGTGNGSAAVGYGRQVYFQMSGGQVIAIGEGWVEPPTDVIIIPSKIGVRPVNVIQWTLPISQTVNAPLIDSGLGDAPTIPSGTVMGILLQRSLDGADWQDVKILPPGTTVFTDTAATADSSYLYRLQILDSAGQNSDFTMSEPAQSLPSLPGIPSMTSVDALSSSSLHILWNPASGQVDQYRIERGPSAGGPFSLLSIVEGGANDTIDTGLTPVTGYFYRVTAINQTGESTPSPALDGTTWTQNLSAPTSLTAVLQNNSQIVLNWTGRPNGAMAVLEFMPFGSQDWLPLATLSADTFTYYPDNPGAYDFRLKFVQGQNESDYAYADGSLVVLDMQSLFLPVIKR